MRTPHLVIAATLLAGLAACGDSATSTAGGGPATPGTPAPSSSAAVAGNSVAIRNFMYTPANLTAAVGTTVTWTNDDAADHTVTSTAGPAAFDSRPDTTAPAKGFGLGKTFTFTFTKPGTYSYHCEIHQFIVGTVTVTG